MLGGKSKVTANFFGGLIGLIGSNRGCFAWLLCGVLGSGVGDMVNGFWRVVVY